MVKFTHIIRGKKDNGQEVHTLNSKNSAYRLLTLIALSGECSMEIVSHMQMGQSYGEKLITRLKDEKYIKTHYKDRLRGYRLTSKGKKMLIQKNPDRFLFYLSGNTDTNRPRSDFTRRLRLQQSSVVYAMMQNAEISIFRDKKPALFQQERCEKNQKLPLPVFYHAREIKELGNEAIKINNSRMMGVLLAEECAYVVFYTGEYLMKWERQTELRVKSMLQYHISRGLLSRQEVISGYLPDTPVKALFIGKDMDTSVKILQSRGGTMKSCFCLDASFDFFHYIPENSAGETILKLLCRPKLRSMLKNLLMSDLMPPTEQLGLEHDAIKDGEPVLFAYEYDLLKISRFATALALHGITGNLVCFDFQKEALEKYFCDCVTIDTIDLGKFEGRFLT